MITNFEEETKPLNDLEKNAATAIANRLMKFHVGVKQRVTGDRIASGMSYMLPMNGARVRKIINYLRTVKGMLIMSDSKGYYIAENDEQIEECIRSQRERAKAILYVADCLEQNLMLKRQNLTL